MQEEYGDDLVVLFVESQGASEETAKRFIMNKGWMGSSALWTSERPFDSGSRGLPNFTLLSADGKVLAKGNHMTSRDKDLVAAEIKAAKGAPEGIHKSFKSAWKNFAKGKFAKAIQEAQKVGMKDEELAAEATSTVEEFERRIQSRFDSINWSIENGLAYEAEKTISELAKSLKGADTLYASAMELQQRFEADDMKLELEASETLGKAIDKLLEDGREEKLFDKVEKLAEKYSGTNAAKRAKTYVSLRP